MKIVSLFQNIHRRIMVRRINRALGIELFDFQIAKIFDDEPFPDYIQRARYCGKTTAQILFVLLCPKLRSSPDLYGFPPKLYVDGVGSKEYGYYEAARAAFFFGEDGVCFVRRSEFVRQMCKIKKQLKKAHIKTHHISYVRGGKTHHI